MNTDDPDIDTVDIDGIRLSFRKRDPSGQRYRLPHHVEEARNPLYPLVARTLRPQVCVDIGSNYGLTALFVRRANPRAKLILVEPVDWLNGFARRNFALNGLGFDVLHAAIVTSDSARKLTFGLNPAGSQDNRVIPETDEWPTIEANTITLDQLMSDVADDTAVYIKIDTQGWDGHVFRGGEQFLARNNRWIVKSEFAPYWIESQGESAERHLEFLCTRYRVFENQAKIPWGLNTLAPLFARQLQPADAAGFTAHVRALGRDSRGWLDLLVIPQKPDFPTGGKYR